MHFQGRGGGWEGQVVQRPPTPTQHTHTTHFRQGRGLVGSNRCQIRSRAVLNHRSKGHSRNCAVTCCLQTLFSPPLFFFFQFLGPTSSFIQRKKENSGTEHSCLGPVVWSNL